MEQQEDLFLGSYYDFVVVVVQHDHDLLVFDEEILAVDAFVVALPVRDDEENEVVVFERLKMHLEKMQIDFGLLIVVAVVEVK